MALQYCLNEKYVRMQQTDRQIRSIFAVKCTWRYVYDHFGHGFTKSLHFCWRYARKTIFFTFSFLATMT